MRHVRHVCSCICLQRNDNKNVLQKRIFPPCLVTAFHAATSFFGGSCAAVSGGITMPDEATPRAHLTGVALPACSPGLEPSEESTRALRESGGTTSRGEAKHIGNQGHPECLKQRSRSKRVVVTLTELRHSKLSLTLTGSSKDLFAWL